VIVPEPSEVTKAAGYAVAGGFGLKVLQWLVRALDIRRRGRLDETKLVLDAQAQLREELRKDNEELRQRIDALEERLAEIEAELRGERRRVEELERENTTLKNDNADLHAELRAFKRGLRSPTPPSGPGTA
jgi:septal ring factor EnvC (AmiA/AmiB activator)